MKICYKLFSMYESVPPKNLALMTAVSSPTVHSAIFIIEPSFLGTSSILRSDTYERLIILLNFSVESIKKIKEKKKEKKNFNKNIISVNTWSNIDDFNDYEKSKNILK